MHYATANNANNRGVNPRLLPGAIIYAIVCGSGSSAAGVVLFFAVTSFFAFFYVLLNSGPRSFGAILVSLIPVVGGLIALGRLIGRAGKQLVGGIFFYLYPLFLVATPINSRYLGALLGGFLFYSFFEYVPGVRNNPRATFMFMWALPTILFFIILVTVLPFFGGAVDVDASDFDSGHHDFGGMDGFSDQYTSGFDDGFIDHDYGTSGYQVMPQQDGIFDFESSNDFDLDHTDNQSYTQDQSFSGDHGFHSDPNGFGDSLYQSYAAEGNEQFDLTSYPDQGFGLPISHPTWLNSDFDPTTGRLSVEGTHGSFDLFSPTHGEFVGYNGDGNMIHISHNSDTHTITMNGPNGPQVLLQDQATGTWSHHDANGMTVIKNDPVTGWTHVRGPDSEMTIKFNPYNSTWTGTGTESL